MILHPGAGYSSWRRHQTPLSLRPLFTCSTLVADHRFSPVGRRTARIFPLDPPPQ
jgi:hypothetical protein